MHTPRDATVHLELLLVVLIFNLMSYRGCEPTLLILRGSQLHQLKIDSQACISVTVDKRFCMGRKIMHPITPCYTLQANECMQRF